MIVWIPCAENIALSIIEFDTKFKSIWKVDPEFHNSLVCFPLSPYNDNTGHAVFKK